MRTPPSGFDLREALDGLRDAIAPHLPAPRDIRAAILSELTTQPMHGYQLIAAIRPTPSAGEVYPALQLLVDEGLATAALDGERKVYTLTDAGRAAATPAPAADAGRSPRDDHARMALPKAGAKLAQAVSAVGHSGTPEQTQRAVALLDETRRKLYAILAEAPESPSEPQD